MTMALWIRFKFFEIRELISKLNDSILVNTYFTTIPVSQSEINL